MQISVDRQYRMHGEVLHHQRFGNRHAGGALNGLYMIVSHTDRQTDRQTHTHTRARARTHRERER